jgi:hypothetical protein
MTLERGFRRILIVISTVLLGSGLVCFVLLAAAWGWSSHLDRRMAARLAKDGCPQEMAMRSGYEYDGGVKLSPVVTRLSQSRWRVAIPKHGHTYFYVLNTLRELTDAQMIRIADEELGHRDFMTPQWQALPGVEIVNCLLATMDISRQNQAGISSRFISWWIERPFVSITLWPVVTFNLDFLFLPAVIASPLMLAAFCTVLAWALFSVVRWIVRGFADG